MDQNAIISELEGAASVMMADPSQITKEQRQAAEAVLLRFRKTKSPYEICRYLLENSRTAYALFEAAEVLKLAIIREWVFLSEGHTKQLRDYLSQYVTTRHNLPGYVQERLVQTIAIIVKRTSVDDGGLERATILTDLENLIINAEHSQKVLGCKIIMNIMQEYATTVKSADVGLPWEVHFRVKKQFEATDLKRIFSFCIRLLAECIQADAPYDEQFRVLLKHLLVIVESVLTWGCVSPLLPKRLIGVYESLYEADQAPNLRLGPAWRPIMLDPSLLPLLFQVYWKVRDIEEIAFHVLASLVQLASLNGAIFTQDDSVHYLTAYMENFLKLVSSVNIRSKEALAVSNIVRKIQLFFVADFALLLPKSLQESFIDEVTRLTCAFAENAAIEDAENDDRNFSDAFDNMLEAWVTILQEFQMLNSGSDGWPNTVLQCATQIFNTYVQCHLSPPDGRRKGAPDDSETEVEHTEDNDRVKYQEQLETIGIFGRVVLDHALPVLYRLLEDRTAKLRCHLHSMQTQAMTLNDATALEQLFEDIHWAILIAGHTLCMDSTGETPLIPSEVMQYSISQHKKGVSDLDTTLTLLADIQQMRADVPADRCDHAIRIFIAVLKLCVVENSAAEVKLGHFMSPEVGCTVMWFLRRWCLSYLMPVEAYYSEISPIICGALGRDTEGANFVFNFVLSKIQSNILHFSSEAVLLQDTVDVFTNIVCAREKSMYVVKTSGLWDLVNIQSKLEPGTLPANIRRGLYRGFTLAGHNLKEEDADQYYAQILRPVQQCFKQLVCQDNFSQIYQQDNVRQQVTDLLEAFNGVAKGCLFKIEKRIFDYLEPVFTELPSFLEIYKHYQMIVHLILELFCNIAKHMLCYLSQENALKFYKSTSDLIKVYAKCNTNRLTNETFAEESSFQDIALVMHLLTYILNKDCLDLCPITIDEQLTEPIRGSDVSLFGLNFIMPLMTMDLLKYPSLCSQYYKLIVLIDDIFPEKICELPDNMLSKLLSSVELGLTHFGADIVQSSCDFIHGLVSHIFRKAKQGSKCSREMERFLRLLLELCLSQQINSDMLDTASASVYMLISCYPERYQEFARDLISSQTDPVISERLADSFAKLTLDIPLNGERHAKIKFRSNYKTFVTTVHGFLAVK